jgi:hypothetical protein
MRGYTASVKYYKDGPIKRKHHIIIKRVSQLTVDNNLRHRNLALIN